MQSFVTKAGKANSISRREFLRMAGATALTAPMLNRQQLAQLGDGQEATSAQPNADKPNILIVVVDQMRDAQWFPDQA